MRSFVLLYMQVSQWLPEDQFLNTTCSLKLTSSLQALAVLAGDLSGSAWAPAFISLTIHLVQIFLERGPPSSSTWDLLEMQILWPPLPPDLLNHKTPEFSQQPVSWNHLSRGFPCLRTTFLSADVEDMLFATNGYQGTSLVWLVGHANILKPNKSW